MKEENLGKEYLEFVHANIQEIVYDYPLNDEYVTCTIKFNDGFITTGSSSFAEKDLATDDRKSVALIEALTIYKIYLEEY